MVSDCRDSRNRSYYYLRKFLFTNRTVCQMPQLMLTLLIYLSLDLTVLDVLMSTLPLPEIDLSMTLKIIEKCFKNDTDKEAHWSLRLSTSLT